MERIRRRLILLEREILELLFKGLKKSFEVILSNGEVLKVGNPRYRFIINSPMVLPKVILSGNDYVAGRAFIEKEIDVEGDIISAMEIKEGFGDFESGLSLKGRLIYLSLKMYLLFSYLKVFELVYCFLNSKSRNRLTKRF